MVKSFLIVLVFFSSSILLAQDDDSYVYGDSGSEVTSGDEIKGGGIDWDKVTIGGNLGMTFGSITYIEIAPTMGYYLTDEVLVGVGVNYIYYAEKRINYSTSIYGGKVFAEYLFPDLPILAHTEAEFINIDLTGNNERTTLVNLYVGGGLKQAMGGSSYLYILGLYNLNETKESFFLQPNPLIRIGVAIGL